MSRTTKRLILRAVTLGMLVSLGAACPVPAPAAAAAPKKPPPELEAVRKAFAAAAAAGDGKAAARLAHFPLDNNVYQAPPKLSEKDFLKGFKQLFVEEATCLATGELQPDPPDKRRSGNSWTIDCDGNLFHFGLRKDKWYYIGYENVNE